MTAVVTDSAMAVIEVCLRAALSDELVPEWEFGTPMGAERDELRGVLDDWPEAAGAPTEHMATLVNNVLNSLLGYPHGYSGERFEVRVGATEEQVATALTEWRQSTGLGPVQS
jgi:hypothetical protein